MISPLLDVLLGDDAIAAQFAPEAELEEFGWFEAALAHAEAAEGVISEDAAAAIASACIGFVPDQPALRAATARDGVVAPDYVRQLRARIGEPYARYLHLGATSQDLIDTSLVRRLLPILPEFDDRLARIGAALDALTERLGPVPLMARTRMQDAIPITVGDRLAAWGGPLPRHRTRLAELSPRLLVLQFGGAAGTLDRLEEHAPAVARRLAEALDLGLPPGPWHSQRDNLAEFASWLSLVSGSLGKIGLDLGLMAQQGEAAIAGGGASSAMPHKSNPIGTEVLVALARHNAGLVGSMHQALLAEQERSGAAWTLEWLTLPEMVLTTAASLRIALTTLQNITRLGGAT